MPGGTPVADVQQHPLRAHAEQHEDNEERAPSPRVGHQVTKEPSQELHGSVVDVLSLIRLVVLGAFVVGLQTASTGCVVDAPLDNKACDNTLLFDNAEAPLDENFDGSAAGFCPVIATTIGANDSIFVEIFPFQALSTPEYLLVITPL